MLSEDDDGEEAVHRKRLAQILQYIASINQTLSGPSESSNNNQHSFVREANRGDSASSDFFQNEPDNDGSGGGDDRRSKVLLSTNDFRKLVRLLSGQRSGATSTSNDPPQAFSFYAAPGTLSSSADPASNRKRLLSGAIRAAGLGRQAAPLEDSGKKATGCWLRITRQASSTHRHAVSPHPDYRSLPVVHRYLQEWLRNTPNPSATSIDGLLQHRLDQAPKAPPTTSAHDARQIAAYLDDCRRQAAQRELEQIYNRLFEHQQSDGDAVLVLGLGHARALVGPGGGNDNDGGAPTARLVNGPLLEVLVEVELAEDGALLVRPREHTGVSLNREVLGALAGSSLSSSSAVSSWHKNMAELEPSSLSPGQPSTYVPLLKRMAVELSSDGIFRPSSSASSVSLSWNGQDRDARRLIMTEAWCLYARPKPSSVFARDALSFAEQLLRGHSNANLSASHLYSNPVVVLPKATWSLTHGPGRLEQVLQRDAEHAKRFKSPGFLGSIQRWMMGVFLGGSRKQDAKPTVTSVAASALFPLPASDAQHRIADLLLTQQYPAVVCEGPPGTGKTHTIANLVCAYLCRGKRVLVTSKNAPALSVLRGRLPSGVRDLCVDVSRSELTGLRQLQQTVERLANRVSSASSTLDDDKCQMLQMSMLELEEEIRDIDAQLEQQGETTRSILQNERVTDLSLLLLEEAPWLMKAVASWDLQDLVALSGQISALVLPEGDPRLEVSGYAAHIDPLLINLCEVKAGSRVASANHATMSALASVPVVGTLSGLAHRLRDLEGEEANLLVNRQSPISKQDWQIVANALRWVRDVRDFQHSSWLSLQRQHAWPSIDFLDTVKARELHSHFTSAVELSQLLARTEAFAEVSAAAECRTLDIRRSKLCLRLRRIAEDLVDATVVSQLSSSFSPDAQSALIRFSQIAGKARFNKTSQPAKLSQRQKRRRQEYLDSFDNCCRYIPCWIMTASQISDYLPAECLFDLVIIDEASQSDVTVLPGMLRGKQWLIVGDSKQVSPSECFVSEDQLDILRAALPSSPLQSSFMPGQSFFDLCSQAFPRGRVVLREHFRCAEEIISFSNHEFYDDNLVPLRIPTASERLSPSLVDVRVPDGLKRGKVNFEEAIKVVELIRSVTADYKESASPRSIGVISLIGEDQSRLIRGLLLDAVGPEIIARHDILIGEPPLFQGAERDIVFLSMVCSKGSAPTQNQLMHFQRANVALSRARDRCVLVRSIDIADVPSLDDMKVPIIAFFLANASPKRLDCQPSWINYNQGRVSNLLIAHLRRKGYVVNDMGEVWRHGICVEHPGTDLRVALLVEHDGESRGDWKSTCLQQRAIERVGWSCMRIDALSLLIDNERALASVERFMESSGIVIHELEEASPSAKSTHSTLNTLGTTASGSINLESAVCTDRPIADACSNGGTMQVVATSSSFPPDRVMDASQFGELVNLDFLIHADQPRISQVEAISESGEPGVSDYEGDDSETGEAVPSKQVHERRRKKYRRLDSYAKDGRWYPHHDDEQDADSAV